jgi:hypothetical protein
LNSFKTRRDETRRDESCESERDATTCMAMAPRPKYPSIPLPPPPRFALQPSLVALYPTNTNIKSNLTAMLDRGARPSAKLMPAGHHITNDDTTYKSVELASSTPARYTSTAPRFDGVQKQLHMRLAVFCMHPGYATFYFISVQPSAMPGSATCNPLSVGN